VRGRELDARVAALHDLERTPEELKDTALRVLHSMLDVERLLANRARSLIRSLARAFDDLDARSFALLTASLETGKNGVIAFGRALHPVLIAAGAIDIARSLAGDPGLDTLRAACLYAARQRASAMRTGRLGPAN
jgi:hypothetical protein